LWVGADVYNRSLVLCYVSHLAQAEFCIGEWRWLLWLDSFAVWTSECCPIGTTQMWLAPAMYEVRRNSHGCNQLIRDWPASRLAALYIRLGKSIQHGCC
jgi:hypothetical protein